MSDAGWLWNEPKTWHDLNRALQDISILLNYLAEQPDARLLSHFGDTQKLGADGAARASIPPCGSYPEFLHRLHQITAAFQTGREDLLPDAQPEADGSPPMSPIAFVYWSRDFLAAVAAPATAHSIRMTGDYVMCRSRCWRGLLPRWRPRRARVPEVRLMPALPADPAEPDQKSIAFKLARWVNAYEWITVAMVLLTVSVSIYALSGRLILDTEKATSDLLTALDAQVEAQEEKIFASPTLPVSDGAEMKVISLCDLGRPETRAARVASTEPVAPSPLRVAALQTEPAQSGPHKWLSARQEHLCAQRDGTLRDLFIVTMHLQSWSSVVARRSDNEWGYDFLHLRAGMAELFGVLPATLHDYATEQNGERCHQVAPEAYKTSPGSGTCETVLWTLINRSRNVANAILGSITQYILPVCYGFLGAMAAALRLIRRKVDFSLLAPTDRSRLQQGAILGVLCGAVIGLFASYLSGTGTSGGLGLSALALLAGYNVDGVFRFLDELSDRIFQPVAAK